LKLRVAAVVAAILLLASLTFWAPPFWVSISTQALLFAIFAMSLDLLLGYTGLPSFGHAAFYGAGAYACAYWALHGGKGLFPLLGVGVLVAALLAAPIGALSLRARGIYFLMLTLAFAQVAWGYTHQSPRDFLGGSDGLIGVARPPLDLLERLDEQLWELAGATVRLPSVRHYYNLVLLAFAACLLLLFLLVSSPFGRTLEGIRENEGRMRSLGCPTFRYQLVAFVVAGTIAGLAGALATLYSGFANSGELYWTNSGLVLIAAILGGSRSLVGPALGAFLVVIVQDALSSMSQRWPLLLGGVFIAFVIFLPGGLVNLGRGGWRAPLRPPWLRAVQRR
jgi:branched-chain amino acid transport system permease protein